MTDQATNENESPKRVTCPECKGKGQMVYDDVYEACHTCHGHTWVEA